MPVLVHNVLLHNYFIDFLPIICTIMLLIYSQLPPPPFPKWSLSKTSKKKVFMKHWSQIIGIFSDTCTDNLNLIKILENINKYAHFIKNKSLS